MTLAERVAEFAAGLEFDDLPADVVASVRLRTLDILGIALASSTSELAPSVLGALKGWGGGACSVERSRPTAWRQSSGRPFRLILWTASQHC
jgi:2-methylcitrate dehydratase PrpD